MLMGAGLGAATSMATGQDPLKGAAIGGAMGGIGGAMSSAPVGQAASSTVNPALTSGAAGTGAYSGATSMMTNPGLTETASSGMFGGLGDAVSSGFDSVKDATGLTNRDVTMMGVNQGLSAMQPTPQQQIQHAPVNISRPQVDLTQGVSPMSSNPRLKRLKMEGLL
jgi:hypothetical protein